MGCLKNPSPPFGRICMETLLPFASKRRKPKSFGFKHLPDLTYKSSREIYQTWILRDINTSKSLPYVKPFSKCHLPVSVGHWICWTKTSSRRLVSQSLSYRWDWVCLLKFWRKKRWTDWVYKMCIVHVYIYICILFINIHWFETILRVDRIIEITCSAKRTLHPIVLTVLVGWRET